MYNQLKLIETMKKENKIKLFEEKVIRSYYNEETEIWYFSLVDIVQALTESANATDYLKKLRKRDAELNSYIGTNCPHVEMLTNGKKRKTLSGTAEHIFRLIQSIPSPKAEPFKQWLAKIAAERLDEMQDPELSIDKALQDYLNLGYSENCLPAAA
jgi:DNA-damage-inducible protein D